MNYQNIYNNLILKAQSRASSRIQASQLFPLVHGHHIIPKCMGGPDINSNIVYFTPREHFIAHVLLIKIYPNHFGLLQAIKLMKSETTNSKTYEWILTKIHEERKGKNKHNDLTYKKISETLLGQNKHTHEYQRQKGIRISKVLKGRTKNTHNHLKQMSQIRKGQTKENCERVKRMSITMTGRTKDTHSHLQIVSDKQNILSEKQRAFSIIAHNNKISITKLYKYFNDDLNISIAYSTLAAMIKREKEFILTKFSQEQISELTEYVFKNFDK